MEGFDDSIMSGDVVGVAVTAAGIVGNDDIGFELTDNF